VPQRATSNGLACGGTALLFLAGMLIVGPVLWGRPALTTRQAMDNAELDRIIDTVNLVRGAVDTMRETRTAELDYLLTGRRQERAAYDNLVLEAHKSIVELHASTAETGSWGRFDPLTDRLLAGLARGASLQDAGRHDEAVAASDIPASRLLIAGIDAITLARVEALRQRSLDIANEIRTSSQLSDQFALISFCLAGVSFALGCIALGFYLRRHSAEEAALRFGRDAALEASILKTRFVATASHDLRQPLHAISMFVGVLRRRSSDTGIVEVVENIATAVASMQRMFASLLDVARLDAYAFKIERRAIALRDLFGTLEVEFATAAEAKGLSLQIQPTSFSVSTDSAMLETILRNLLANAVKFTDRGWVGVATRRNGAEVDIIVFDTGIGIALEDQSKIFGQFERLSHPGGAREGLGLGLSIVQWTANLLGVTVSLESRPGHGTQFTLSLPYAEPEQATTLDPAGSGLDLRGHSILILDDHSGACGAIALAIETLGGVPLGASSPDAALDLLAAMAPETPYAAVVDHDLGNRQTGPDFLDAYAARNGYVLPAVIITGSTEASTLASLAAGGRPWLIKPVDLEAFRLVLSGLVGSSVDA
jgi:signal transduction histidine kinase